MSEYTDEHAKAGLKEKLPEIECFLSQFRNYEITIVIPEFTSVCPRTGFPDFGKITIRYMPQKFCVELKSLKMYLIAYRNLGIFYENVINRVLDDFAKVCKPKWAIVTGEFSSRGGIHSIVEAKYPRSSKFKAKR